MTTKYMLIDQTTVEETTVLLIGTLLSVQLHGKLLKAQGRNVIAPPLEARAFAKFELLQLQYLYWNVMQQTPPADYAQLGPALRQHLDTLPLDETPLDVLEAAVAKLAPVESDDEPEPKKEIKLKKEAKPKVIKTPGASPERPAAITITGKVWVIADEVLSGFAPLTATTDWKPLRTAIVAKCVAAGINESTAVTQYSKYKASKLAAL